MTQSDQNILPLLSETVSTYQLSQIFKISPETVRRKLATVQPVRIDGKNRFWNFIQACEYLVEPRIDIAQHIQQMRPSDLPVPLRKEIWDAKLKQQAAELAAGDLWRTEDVLEAFSEIFADIKSQTVIWSDQLERETQITEEQRKLLSKRCDDLLDNIYKQVVMRCKEKRTKSTIAELEEELAKLKPKEVVDEPKTIDEFFA